MTGRGRSARPPTRARRCAGLPDTALRDSLHEWWLPPGIVDDAASDERCAHRAGETHPEERRIRGLRDERLLRDEDRRLRIEDRHVRGRAGAQRAARQIED